MASKVEGKEYSTEEPLNREPKVVDLVKDFITKEGAYDRNHGPIPHLSTSEHRLKIIKPPGEGLQINSLFTIERLKRYTQHEVTCALQCAGNRRHTMRTQLKEVSGLDWFDGAVMNCTWRGPKLRDVLMNALGAEIAKRQGLHVQFACTAVAVQEDSYYGASIPLRRALSDDADVILAMEMNGEPLTAAHGAPLRVIVPGVAGARSVKWLDTITISEEESQNHYMQRDYKVLPPDAIDAESAEKYWGTTPPLMDMPVNSVIAFPVSEDTIELSGDILELKGYALPQGDQGPVVKVEVSVDDGKTWREAEIQHEDGAGKWAWALWHMKLPKSELKEMGKASEDGKSRTITFFGKATDRGGNTQEPAEWNLRGVAYNGYGEARDVRVVL